jgi:chloramphenicol 3-O-phosphotransferase
MKTATEKDCLLEIEKQARLICDYKHDYKSLEDCRKALSAALFTLAEIRANKEKLKTAREAERYRKKMGMRKSQQKAEAVTY